MGIRQAIWADIPELMPICYEHFRLAKMEDRGYSYDRKSAEQSLKGLFCLSGSIIRVYEDDQKRLQGIILFTKNKSIFNIEDWSYNEVLWYGRTPTIMIELFNHVLESCFGACIIVGIPVKESLRRFLTKRGFSLSGYNYLKKEA